MPGLAWAFFIFVLCGLPSSNTGSFTLWDMFSIDKLLHFSVFALLSLILKIGFKRQCNYQFLKLHANTFAVVFSFTYSLFLEYLQINFFEDRSADWIDVLANTIGALNGITLFKIVYGNPRIKTS